VLLSAWTKERVVVSSTATRTRPSSLPPELSPRRELPPRRRKPGARLRNLIAFSLSLLVLFVSVGGYVVVQWFDGSIARIHLSLGQDRPKSAGAKGSQNWLLVGTDSREGSAGQFGDAPGERSDTTILTHLDAKGVTTNVSIPRDTLVTIPEFKNAAGETIPEHKAKFNSALSEGGASLLVRTVEKLTNVRVDHYVSVDLEGFSKISKALNGVPVCILQAPAGYAEDNGRLTNINDGYSGFHGKYGNQVVVGDQAVAFVRQRHGLPGSDFARIQRQQQFLGAVFRKATQANLLLNPVRVASLLSAIKDAITLDQDTSITDLEKLALSLRGVAASAIAFETLPTRGITMADTDQGAVSGNPNAPSLIPKGQTADVGNVLLLKQPDFATLVAKLKDQPVSAAPSAQASVAPKITKVSVAPADVFVTVQNGVGRTGLAGQVAGALQGKGFKVAPPNSADHIGYPTTLVRYAPGQIESAKTVAAAVPGSQLQEDATVSNGIVLTLGNNYTSVTSVQVIGQAAPTQPVTPSAAPTAAPLVTAASASNSCTY
jgi:LCP family protein required for cell wall assembly